MQRWRFWLSRLAFVLLTAGLVLWIGTLIHELAHAAVGIAYGVRITRLHVLDLDLYPALAWRPIPQNFGRVDFDRALQMPARAVMAAAGSLSTLATALFALGLLWITRPRRWWMRMLLVGFAFSWIDVIYHTFPLGGYAEAYDALVALGAAPQGLAVGLVLLSTAIFVLTVVRWWQLAEEFPAR